MSTKIKLKQLHPNPFRDMTHYPIHREKLEMLKASIRTTGFWDNLLVRKAGASFEVAYGHHRLEALKELVGESVIDEEYELELPVRNLDDAAMIRIMASENIEEYRVTSDIIDETVRVTREFISHETKTPASELSAADISQFLGGGWNEDKISASLQRLGLFDRGTLKREQLKGLSLTAAKGIQREVAKVEKAVTRAALEEFEDDDEITEEERKRARHQAQRVAKHVAEALSEHVKNGGSAGKLTERSFDAQVETIPEDAAEDEKRLSTIDAAAKAVNARDFQRKIEMLMRYREYMSDDAKHELVGTLREVMGWCKQMVEELSS
ncbi:MAG TPA: ParB/RepB/Spo0J family partition protein [Planctomycetota bacterium]|nr:ParB/RepB/Spo0J family partition protein [Planctomycetota bacterium]